MIAIGIDNAGENVPEIHARLNGEPCQPLGKIELPMPRPDGPILGFEPPLSALQRGYNLIELHCVAQSRIGWVEIEISQ